MHLLFLDDTYKDGREELIEISSAELYVKLYWITP